MCTILFFLGGFFLFSAGLTIRILRLKQQQNFIHLVPKHNKRATVYSYSSNTRTQQTIGWYYAIGQKNKADELIVH